MLCYSYYSDEARELLSDVNVDRVIVLAEIERVEASPLPGVDAELLEKVARLIVESDASLAVEADADVISVERAINNFVYEVVKEAASSVVNMDDIIVSVALPYYDGSMVIEAKVWAFVFRLGTIKLVLELNVCALD